MKKHLISTVLLLSMILFFNPVFSQDIGSIFCWHYKEIYSGHDYLYNQSIVKRGLPTDGTHWSNNLQWWENIAEEIAYSGLDYIALLSRGNQPNAPDRGNGNPKHIPTLIDAMHKRGVANSFKMAIFDDPPQSWAGSKNWEESGGTVFSPSTHKFDCSVTDNYKYIWDYNLKQAIAHIPEEMRYEIDGRMVIFFWTVSDSWFLNMQGNLSKILKYVKEECQKTFGFEPYIIIQESWFERDSSLSDSGTFDAVHGWLAQVRGRSWSFVDYNGEKTGVIVPGFYNPNTGRYMDPSMGTDDNGTMLRDGLDNTVGAGARTTLIEGFTNAAETAALWRSTDMGHFKYYDYPNQRLNNVRRYSSNPFPETLRVEAEACDFYHDVTPGNSAGAYRHMTDLDIKKSTDIYGGWYVTDTEPTEWMEWLDLPLLADTRFDLRYKSTAASSVKISIDGEDLPAADLPSTDGIWTTIDIGTVTLPENGYHTIRLTIVSGSPDINYFNRTSSTAPIYNPGHGSDATVVISSPTDNASIDFATGFTLQVDASHPSGFEWMQLWVNKDNDDPFIYETIGADPWEFDVSGLFPGAYTLFVRAKDNDGGYTNSEKITVTLYDDGSHLSVAISSPTNNSSFDAGNDLKITVYASHPLGFEWMRLWMNKDGGEFDVYEIIHNSPWEFNVTDLSAGTYSFFIRARDNAGGRTDSDRITVTIYDDLSSSINESYSQNIVSIYPNPANDFVRIVSNKEIGEISLFSIRGELQMREYVTEKEMELNVSTLKPGLYFLTINNRSHKLIVK